LDDIVKVGIAQQIAQDFAGRAGAEARPDPVVGGAGGNINFGSHHTMKGVHDIG
jgi:hypothetical protein